MKKRIRLNQKGITLIELLVAFAICGIVVGGIYRVFITQTKAYTIHDQVVEVQQNIRTAMEILLRDLRMAGYDSDSLTSKISIGPPAIPQITPGDHEVTVNYEYDDTHRYEVKYYLDNGILWRQLMIWPDGAPSTSTTDKILENVEALRFEYGVDSSPLDGAMDDLNGDGKIDENDWVQAGSVGTAKVVAVRVTLTAKPDQTNPDVKKMVLPRTLSSTVALRNQTMTW